MKILSAVIVKNKYGPDRINMKIDLPSSVFPFDKNAYIFMDTANGIGVEYFKEYFKDIPFKVIDTNTKATFRTNF